MRDGVVLRLGPFVRLHRGKYQSLLTFENGAQSSGYSVLFKVSNHLWWHHPLAHWSALPVLFKPEKTPAAAAAPAFFQLYRKSRQHRQQRQQHKSSCNDFKNIKSSRTNRNATVSCISGAVLRKSAAAAWLLLTATEQAQ